MGEVFRKTTAARYLTIAVIAAAFLALTTGAQIRIPKDKIKVPVKAPRLPDLDRLLEEEPPVSTGLPDAVFDIPFLDGHNPIGGALMTFLPITHEAVFPLPPGLWDGWFQSYCLKPGAFGPGEGSGYAYAPLKGKRADIVARVLRNSVDHPELDQEDVQLLLWAVIAKTKLSECGKGIQDAARILLAPRDYDTLNGGALGKIPRPVLSAALRKMPPAARDALEAEAKLRDMFVRPIAAPYHEIESIAVRAGEVLPPPDSRNIALGRWSYDPDGYFVRYLPYNYRNLRVQIYHPESFFIGTDDLGLITSIADRQGARIEFIYDREAEPLFFPGDDRVAGIALKELTLTWPDLDGKARTRSVKDAGWVLAGAPSGGWKPAPSASPRFPDARERYQSALRQGEDIDRLMEMLAKADPERKGVQVEASWSVIFLGSCCQALRTALSLDRTDPRNPPDEMMLGAMGLAYRSWMKGLALLAGNELQGGGLEAGIDERPSDDQDDGGERGPRRSREARELPRYVWVKKAAPSWEKETRPRKPTASGLPEFVPHKKVAQPGNTHQQRLGQSARKSATGNGREAAERTRKMIGWFSAGTSAGSSAAGKLMGAATPYGIPQKLAGYTIGRTVGIWGDCIDAIAMDPPRADYTVLARPETGKFVPIQPGGEVSKARAEAANAFLAAAVDLATKMRAAKFSVERHSGALRAGAPEWAKAQLENAIRYERESGLAMLDAAARLEALVKAAKAEGIRETLISAPLIESYRDSLRREGFSSEETEVCRTLNFTEEEIAELKAAILAGIIEAGPEGLYASALELAKALREFAALWLALPHS